MRPELKVMCPKCKALPGDPCRSILHEGPVRAGVGITMHKKRTGALYGSPSTESAVAAVPGRPASRSRARVGLVDSALRGLR